MLDTDNNNSISKLPRAKPKQKEKAKETAPIQDEANEDKTTRQDKKAKEQNVISPRQQQIQRKENKKASLPPPSSSPSPPQPKPKATRTKAAVASTSSPSSTEVVLGQVKQAQQSQSQQQQQQQRQSKKTTTVQAKAKANAKTKGNGQRKREDIVTDEQVIRLNTLKEEYLRLEAIKEEQNSRLFIKDPINEFREISASLESELDKESLEMISKLKSSLKEAEKEIGRLESELIERETFLNLNISKLEDGNRAYEEIIQIYNEMKDEYQESMINEMEYMELERQKRWKGLEKQSIDIRVFEVLLDWFDKNSIFFASLAEYNNIISSLETKFNNGISFDKELNKLLENIPDSFLSKKLFNDLKFDIHNNKTNLIYSHSQLYDRYCVLEKVLFASLLSFVFCLLSFLVFVLLLLLLFYFVLFCVCAVFVQLLEFT